jgi:hypothetical protein
MCTNVKGDYATVIKQHAVEVYSVRVKLQAMDITGTEEPVRRICFSFSVQYKVKCCCDKCGNGCVNILTYFRVRFKRMVVFDSDADVWN